MTDQFQGTIQAFAFGLVPKGWALCNGQLLPINQNQALFSLLGTTFGGNGSTTFGLPNLQGMTPLCYGNSAVGNYAMGQSGGEANHTLVANEMPTHNHPLVASSGTAPLPAISPIDGSFPAQTPSSPGTNFATTSDNTPLGPGSSSAGGGQAHQNMQPYLALNFCIALVGIYPSRQ